MKSRVTSADRVLGALYGFAIGDGLGLPTRGLRRDEVVARYGEVLGGFLPAPLDQPTAPGAPAGSVTVETRRVVEMSSLVVVRGGRLGASPLAVLASNAQEPLPQTDGLDAVRGIASRGGLARIVPLALTMSAGQGLVDAAVACARLYGDNSAALGGATGLAAGISTAIQFGHLGTAVSEAARSARLGSQRGRWVASADVSSRISWVAQSIEADEQSDPLARRQRLLDLIVLLIGTGADESQCLPAAVGCAIAFAADPWMGVRVAASVGGACGLIAAMTGAFLGGCYGPTVFPAEARQIVSYVNDIDFESLADSLIALRPGALNPTPQPARV